MTPTSRSKAPPAGRRAKPGSTGEGDFYHIEVFSSKSLFCFDVEVQPAKAISITSKSDRRRTSASFAIKTLAGRVALSASPESEAPARGIPRNGSLVKSLPMSKTVGSSPITNTPERFWPGWVQNLSMSAATALRPRLGQMCLNQKSPLRHRANQQIKKKGYTP